MNPDFSLQIRQRARNQMHTYLTFGKWVLLSAAAGLLIGLIGTAFHTLVNYAATLRGEHPWILYFLPLIGVGIVFLYRSMGLREDKGTNLVLLAVRDNESMSLRQMICIFVATVLTHLGGGSSGREGAALQIGGSFGNQCARRLRLDAEDSRIMVMCGMSACFSALFCTPIAAAFFAMEVVSIGILHYSAIVPCMVSALVGCAVSGHFGAAPMSMQVAIPGLNGAAALRVCALAILCAVLSYVFCIAIHSAAEGYRKVLKNPYLRAAVGGVIVILLTLLIGTRDYNGAGTDVILRAFTDRSSLYAFALKLALTALTLGAGYKGGEIVPVFFVGATFGSAMSGLLGMDCSFGAAIGIVALFCGVTNCPLTSLFLSVELFGSGGILYYGLAIAIAYMLSGYAGLYSEQKILYSKLKPHYINKTIGAKKPEKGGS